MSFTRLRVQERAFLASLVKRHTVSCTGCRVRGEDAVLRYTVVH